MKALFMFTVLSICLPVKSCISQTTDLSAYENDCIKVFNEFTETIASVVQFNKTNSFDDVAKSKLYSLLFLNSKISDDSINHIAYNKSVDMELDQFYQYLLNQNDDKLIQHLKLVPFRKKKNEIYQQLTSFQKENAFVYFDDRNPEKILCYILFIPKVKNIEGPKIWSWTLMYKFGKFVFRSVDGKEGEEYLFSPESF